MRRIGEQIQGLLALGEMLDPSEPVSPGVEHVMVEIAPGVFRSLHRQRTSPASKLLRELNAAKAVHDNVKAQFTELTRRVHASRRGQR
jgi:hypothetical protein